MSQIGEMGCWTTIVCIDSYENGVPIGRFYNPHLDGGRTFQSMTQFLLELEKTLDLISFPKSFTAARTFAPMPEWEAGVSELEYWPGLAGTFAIRVLFRQNASWQGSVAWLEGRREQSFRSVLELILLMDSALCCVKAS